MRCGLVWIRRDLRANDNAALAAALRRCAQVHVVFVFDSELLDPLPRQDRRVEFICQSLACLDEDLRGLARNHQIAGAENAGLIVLHGRPDTAIPRLAMEVGADAVFVNRDNEPSARQRDAKVRGLLANAGIAFFKSKDTALFERDDLLTKSGQSYAVFTPYKRAWMAALSERVFAPHEVEPHAGALAPRPIAYVRAIPSVIEIGFEPTNLGTLPLPAGTAGGMTLLEDFLDRIDRYTLTRDYPGIKGPSYLGVHLRFGTLSIRHVAGCAQAMAIQGMAGAQTWLAELCWREFFMQVLYHRPDVVEHAFHREYDRIVWLSGAAARTRFEAWCAGRTGYPFVDAGMRQLNQTGYMHNRLRMVTASFLVKDLGVDWHWGERYFAQQLNDYDLAANNGNWQWAASTGCDAQPWFRIFNPVTQSTKFDPEGRFIRRYVPEIAALPDNSIHAPWEAPADVLATAGITLARDYPRPLVDHAAARENTLQRYAKARGDKAPASKNT